MCYFATEKWKEDRPSVFTQKFYLSIMQFFFGLMNEWGHKATIASHFHTAS